MKRSLTVITPSPMSKIEVMPSMAIEIVTVSDIHTRSASGRFSLKLGY